MNGNQAHSKGQRDELLPLSGAMAALKRRWGKQQGTVPAGWVLRYISVGWALRLNKGTSTDLAHVCQKTWTSPLACHGRGGEEKREEGKAKGSVRLGWGEGLAPGNQA